jgi:predicted nucleotidyltransferase
LELRTDILQALAYFDLFSYPLTQIELFQFLQHPHSYEDFQETLSALMTERLVFRTKEFLSIRPGHELYERRLTGNAMAHRLLVKAEKVAGLLYRFPFVRGVGVSGSLSKNYADEQSDIDFFIITAPNRLWVCRTLLHLLKKLSFLANKQHYLCMNYFVSESALEISEKNIYTATEIVTLIPLRGSLAFARFYQKNDWTKSFLPLFSLKVSRLFEKRPSIVKKCFEATLDFPLFSWTERPLMHLTRFFWTRKTKARKRNMRGLVMSMSATPNVAKPDPVIFQEELLRRFDEKCILLSGYPEAVVPSSYN